MKTFAWGSEVTISKWIIQIILYFDINGLKPKTYVAFMVQMIIYLYFKEVVIYTDFQNFDFR